MALRTCWGDFLRRRLLWTCIAVPATTDRYSQRSVVNTLWSCPRLTPFRFLLAARRLRSCPNYIIAIRRLESASVVWNSRYTHSRSARRSRHDKARARKHTHAMACTPRQPGKRARNVRETRRTDRPNG